MKDLELCTLTHKPRLRPAMKALVGGLKTFDKQKKYIPLYVDNV